MILRKQKQVTNRTVSKGKNSMKIANLEMDHIEIFDSTGELIVVLSDNEIIKHKNCSVKRCDSDLMFDEDSTELDLFEIACEPLIKYLNNHMHPHASVIVTTASAELKEGVKSYCTEKFIND